MKLQLHVDYSERVPKIKKALTTTDETTSYIQIFKPKLQLQVYFSERISKIKKALTATDETTSYIPISKKKK